MSLQVSNRVQTGKTGDDVVKKYTYSLPLASANGQKEDIEGALAKTNI
jgi:hypothetical protein